MLPNIMIPSQDTSPFEDCDEVSSRVEQQSSKCNEIPSGELSTTYRTILPKFFPSEIKIGTLLGAGTFSTVYGITSICLIENNQNTEQQLRCRDFLSKHVHQETTEYCRYVMKCLRKDVINNKELYKNASVELSAEAKILSSISHANVITIRGHGSSCETESETGLPEGYFLILDRLYETLDQRIQKWRLQEKGRTFRRLSLQKKLFTMEKRSNSSIPRDRIKISVGISAALKYLHGRNIIYRDLKPENLGFDARGEIKLFDFAFSKDLSTSIQYSDGTYKLTSGIGTLRYMAPEVAKGETYNFSADVYSFIILMWELLTLNQAYQNFTKEKLFNEVIYGTYRPKMDHTFPGSLQSLLEDGWSSYLYERPSMDVVFESLVEIEQSAAF